MVTAEEKETALLGVEADEACCALFFAAEIFAAARFAEFSLDGMLVVLNKNMRLCFLVLHS